MNMVRQVKLGRADRMKEDGLKFADSYYGEMAHYGLYRNCENADLTGKKQI